MARLPCFNRNFMWFIIKSYPKMICSSYWIRLHVEKTIPSKCPVKAAWCIALIFLLNPIPMRGPWHVLKSRSVGQGPLTCILLPQLIEFLHIRSHTTTIHWWRWHLYCMTNMSYGGRSEWKDGTWQLDYRCQYRVGTRVTCYSHVIITRDTQQSLETQTLHVIGFPITSSGQCFYVRESYFDHAIWENGFLMVE